MSVAGPARLRSLDRLLAIAEAAEDERRAELARLVQALAGAERELAAHEARMLREWEVGRCDPQSASGLDAWLRGAEAERRRLHARRAGLLRGEQAAREALRDAFAETKRLDVLAGSLRRALRKKAEQRGQALAEDAEAARASQRDGRA